MNLQLWQHASGSRYIVLIDAGTVRQAAGPLSDEQMRAAQRDEWSIPWQRGLGEWVEERRGEFERVWPVGGEAN